MSLTTKQQDSRIATLQSWLTQLSRDTSSLQLELEEVKATYTGLLTQLQTLQTGITTDLDGHTHPPVDFVESNTPAFIQLRVINAFAEIRDNTVSLWNTVVSQQLMKTDLFAADLTTGVLLAGTKETIWSVFIPQGAEILGYADWSTVYNLADLTILKAKVEVLHPTNEVVYTTSGWQGYELDGGLGDTLEGVAWALRLSWKNEEALSNFRIRLTHEYSFTPSLGFGWIPGQINVFHI